MAYVVYKYVNILYVECRVKKFVEHLCYLGYFAIITFIHIIFKVPIIVFLSNLLLIGSILLLYRGGIKKAILSSMLICLSLACVETVFAFLTSFIRLNPMIPYEYTSAFGIVVIRIASYVFVLIIDGFKNIKIKQPLPTVYWLCLLSVPTGTIFMLFSIFTSSSITEFMMIVCIMSALGINVFTFYLYDKISSLLISQMNTRVAEEQNRYYEYQVQMMKSTLETMSILRHDLKNKLSPLYGLAKTGKSVELVEQLEELMDICHSSNEYSTSGHTTVDSIINFKLQHAEIENILVTTDIFIPSDLMISTFDIAVILGNLLDNALESVIKSSTRWIDLKMKYTKGRLIVEVSNSYDGIIARCEDDFLSLKEDPIHHGMGIKSVQRILLNYDGALQITYDEEKFHAKLLMYL